MPVNFDAKGNLTVDSIRPATTAALRHAYGGRSLPVATRLGFGLSSACMSLISHVISLDRSVRFKAQLVLPLTLSVVCTLA